LPLILTQALILLNAIIKKLDEMLSFHDSAGNALKAERWQGKNTGKKDRI
jgi:hypothetical protein